MELNSNLIKSMFNASSRDKTRIKKLFNTRNI